MNFDGATIVSHEDLKSAISVTTLSCRMKV